MDQVDGVACLVGSQNLIHPVSPGSCHELNLDIGVQLLVLLDNGVGPGVGVLRVVTRHHDFQGSALLFFKSTDLVAIVGIVGLHTGRQQRQHHDSDQCQGKDLLHGFHTVHSLFYF